VIYIEASLTGETEPLELIEEHIRFRLLTLLDRFFDIEEFENTLLHIVKEETKSSRCKFDLSIRPLINDRYYNETSKMNVTYGISIYIVRCKDYEVHMSILRVLIETEDQRIILPLEIRGLLVKKLK
jgi:hypothetical protein